MAKPKTAAGGGGRVMAAAAPWKGRIRGLVEALRGEFPKVDIRVRREKGAVVRLFLSAPRARPIIAVVINFAREYLLLSATGPDDFRRLVVDRVYAAAAKADRVAR